MKLDDDQLETLPMMEFQPKIPKERRHPTSMKEKYAHIYALFVLILFSTFKPVGYVLLEQINITKKPVSKPAIYGLNVDYATNFTWKKSLDATRQVHSKNLYTKINLPAYALVREMKTLYHFQNVYISKYGIVQNEHDLNIVNEHRKLFRKTKIEITPNPDPMFYYNKVVLGYSKHTSYGHFIMDELCALIQIPHEYFEDAEIFINFPASASKIYLNLLGFNESRVHSLENYYIFCKEVVTLVSSDSINSLLVCGMPLLRTKMFAALNLSNTKPTKYLILNRKKGIWGRLQNVEELHKVAKIKFPQYNWEVVNDSIVYSVLDSSRWLSSTKLLVTTAGSMNMNCIFMHPGSAVCVCGSKVLDYPVLAVSYSLDLWCIYTNGYLLHGKVDPKPYPTQLFIESLSLIIEAQETGAWPKSASQHYLYTWPMKGIIKDISNGVPSYFLKPYYYYSERSIE